MDAPKFREVIVEKRATQLSQLDTLADGAIVLNTSHQLRWFYAQIVKDGRMRRRRYRHDQMVRVRELVPG